MIEYNSLIIGQTIRDLRVERHLSQDVLSGLAGIARSHLSMIETGSKHANLETVWRIANALDMDASELIRCIEEHAQ